MDKTVKEFFDFVTMEIEVYHLDEVYPTELYVYNYIKKVTDNFDKISLHYFLKEISIYFDYMPIKFYEDVMFKGKSYKKNETIRFIDLVHIHFKETGHYNELDNILDKYNFIKNNFADLLELNVEQALNIYEIATQKHTTLNNTNPPPKPPLTFSGLFKYPYNQNLEQFKKKLQECNFIDINHQWREVDNNGKRIPKKEIGEFYNWLYSETTVFSKTTDPTNECICFCKEFGIIAYKEGEKPATGRIVTVELITKAVCDRESGIKYNTHFETWINKKK